MTRRALHLGGAGHVLISTDVHGNEDDLDAAQRRWEALRAADPDARWVILGDLVHGPSEDYRQREPGLYGWPDASVALIERLWTLLQRHPEHVFFVMGNHDAAHVGGRPVRKFYEDEAAHLESKMTPAQHAMWQVILLDHALLAVSTSCGVLLTHGAPDEALSSLALLDAIAFPLDARTPQPHRDALEGVLYAYGQRQEVVARLLERLSAEDARLEGRPLRVVIHGHDRDPAGFFTEGDNQVCPVIFGAPREARRCVVLRLDEYYEDAQAVCARALLCLHGAA